MNLNDAIWIIPNPMDEQADAVGNMAVKYRKYLVIRFKEPYAAPGRSVVDTQASIIYKLGSEYPLTLVIENGEDPLGLEAWFKVEGWSEERCRALMDFACRLGADPATFDPMEMVRLPGAVNPETGKRHKMVYMDPEGDQFPNGPHPLQTP